MKPCWTWAAARASTAFLAARQVGASGTVIGVDMTPDMVSKARANAVKGGYANVEFRLGEIEHLPVADATVDVIISNCVINLSPDKAQVFRDAFRVLKTGGRLAISDIVTTAPLPEASAARTRPLHRLHGRRGSSVDDLDGHARRRRASPTSASHAKDASREFIRHWAPGRGVEDYVSSATIEAVKPG